VNDPCSQRHELGAYLLGALGPVERAAVEDHIGGCASCRDELAWLSGLPGLLARVGPEEIIDPPAPPALGRLIASASRRRRRRRRLAGAAASLALAAGGGALAVTLVSRAPSPPMQSVTAAGPATGVTATMNLEGRSWGTAVRVRLRGVRPGQRCVLVVMARDGRREPAGAWRASYEGRADVAAASSIPFTDVAMIRVMDGRGRVLAEARRA
jgi:hypothetical protein